MALIHSSDRDTVAFGRRLRIVSAFCLTLALSACGGGGGGDTTPTPTPQPMPSGDTVISGKISFERVPHNLNNGLNYGATRADPARAVTVQILSTAGAVLATGVTDDNGDYSLTVDAGQSVRVRVLAELVQTGTPSWNFSVVDNTASDALFVLDGPDTMAEGDAQTRNLLAESGWGGSSYTGERAAGPFAILDSVYEAVVDMLDVDGALQFPQLVIHWSENNRPQAGDESVGDITTSFYTRRNGQSEIFLLGAANQDTDEYDTHVVIHEWGHYWEDNFSRSDSVGGAHSGGDRLDLRVAFSEGFGYALAGMVTDDPITRDSGGQAQAQGFQIDVEDDNIATNFSGNLNPGWYSEGSIQLILYDLYDSVSDANDSVSLGLGPIVDTLRGSFATDTAVASIFSFAEALRAAQPASAAGIDALLTAKDIVAVGNDRFGSSETNNAGNASDVLPIVSDLQTDGTPVEVCSIGGTGFGDFGVFNKLSNRRLLRFEVTVAGTYRITAQGVGANAAIDPDIALFQGDFLGQADSVTPGLEVLNTNTLSAGEYIVEVYDFANLRPDQVAHNAGRYCINVSVQAI